MKIRAFNQTEKDYEAVIVLKKLLEPEEKITLSMLQEQDAETFTNHQLVRVIGEVKNQVIASAAYWNSNESLGSESLGSESSEDESSYRFTMLVHPDYQDGNTPSLMHNYLLSKIEEASSGKTTVIISEPKEDEVYLTQLLENSDFELKMRFPRSILNVNSFDTTPYDDLKTKLASQGIEFITLSDVIKIDSNWQENIWRLFTIIDQDVPYPDPQESVSFEDYSQYYKDELFRPDSWIIAVDTHLEGKQKYVGMSVVNVMPTRPDTVYAGITGVIPSHRRQKIATMLKVSNVTYVQQQGLSYIYTDNEENNPMYDLNMLLGFNPLPAWVYYQKQT